MRREVSAGGLVVEKYRGQWQILLMKDMNGNWTFPKGLVEDKEPIEKAARREVFEEVGVSHLKLISPLTPIHYLYYRDGLIKKTVHYLLFLASGRQSLRVQTQEGISEVEWFTFPVAFKIIGYPKTNQPLLKEAARILASYGHQTRS